MSNVRELTDNDLDTTLQNSGVPVLVVSPLLPSEGVRRLARGL